MEITNFINIKDNSIFNGKENIKKLFLETKKNNYESNIWGTFKSFLSHGLVVKKGQKAIKLLYPVIKKDENNKDVVVNYYSYFFFNKDQTELLNKDGGDNE